MDWEASEGGRPFLHPGRAALIRAGGRELGWLGELHPLVARAWDLDRPGVGFELDFDALVELSGDGDRQRTGTSRASRRCCRTSPWWWARRCPAQRVEEAVRRGGGELLGRVSVFDLYRGEQVGEGHKSLALRLEFRAPDRTLTDEEVAERRDSHRARARLAGRPAACMTSR